MVQLSRPIPKLQLSFFLISDAGIRNPKFIKFQLSPRPRLRHPLSTNKFVEIDCLTLVYTLYFKVGFRLIFKLYLQKYSFYINIKRIHNY